MISMICKCGSAQMTFKHLSERDFPNGWETDCCKTKRAEPKPEPVEELEKAPEPAPAPEPKRKSRKK